jgi:hypothetical protein
MKKYSKIHSNPHLYNSAQKHGTSCFVFEILETFDNRNESVLRDREMFWMLHYKTTDRQFGYNLRMDSSSRGYMHPETLKKHTARVQGVGNPNYGNKWTDAMKKHMSCLAKAKHEGDEIYGNSWRKKISIATKQMWEEEGMRDRISKNVSLGKQKYNFEQYSKGGELLRVWASVKDVVDANPEYKWQNIYAATNGHKKSYMGFVWKKALKEVGHVGT